MMENLYNKLVNDKNNGIFLYWDDIGESELEELFDLNITDSMIATLFNIKKSQVTYKRNKYGIGMYDSIQRKILRR